MVGIALPAPRLRQVLLRWVAGPARGLELHSSWRGSNIVGLCDVNETRARSMDHFSWGSQEEAGFQDFEARYPFTRNASNGLGFPGKFDWLVDKRRRLPPMDPRSVFINTAHPGKVAAMLDQLEEGYNDSQQERVMYVSGDIMLSKADRVLGAGTLTRMQRLFRKGIFWQAYNVPLDGFRVAPDGLNARYMRPVWGVAQAAIDAAGISAASKPNLGALAAWGFRNTFLDDRVPARRKLREWVQTDAARAAGIDHRCLEQADYWRELATYRFLVSPRGGGIQSPKNDEALLVYTVPITTREGFPGDHTVTEPTFPDLRRLGWPIVVLDEWSEITAERMDQWWTELSPRLPSFRANCLSAEGFWRIVTGALDRCE